jgi:hypothetical protein
MGLPAPTLQSLVDRAACSGLPEKDALNLIIRLLAAQGGITGDGFEIPPYDDIVIAYIGATNNIDTVTYSKDGDVVATLTFTYAAAGAADDDLVIRVQKS